MFKKVLIGIFLFSFCYSIFACWAEQCTCGIAIPSKLTPNFNLTRSYDLTGYKGRIKYSTSNT